MNINVGIELGCAIRAHGEEQILLVLNEHYGGREFLPFHLQDLGGPVTYHLPPDATKEQIDAALSKLRGKFVTAIREFLKKAGAAATAEPTFRRVPSSTSVAAWYAPGETIAEFDNETSYGLRPAHSRCHQFVTRIPKASASSLPPWLLRLLPAGAVAGWALHPLESAALSRRAPVSDVRPDNSAPQASRNTTCEVPFGCRIANDVRP
jgi:hypothetical protein